MLYLLLDKALSGPFDDAEVRSRLHSGELDGHVMSWRIGEHGWTSLGKRWPLRAATIRRRITRALATVLVVSASVLAIKLPGGWFMAWLPLTLQRAALLWLLVVACAVIAAGGLYVLMRASTRRGMGPCAAVLTVYVACALAFALGAASIDDQVLRIRQHSPGAQLSFDPVTHALHIKGPIGASLPTNVKAMLKRYPQTGNVVLDSPGGLLEPAFAVAEMLAKRNVTATVDGMCASACVAIWAAIPQRRMTITSRVGLHQLRIGIDLPRDMKRDAKRESTRRYDRVLAAAGFNQSLLSAQKRTSPDDIYWVQAPELAAAGVDLSVVDADGQPVSMPATQWRLLERHLGHDNVAATLLRAVRQHEPQWVPVFAGKLYAAWKGDQPGRLRKAARLLGMRAKHQALRQASDAAVLAWAGTLQQMLADGLAHPDAPVCAVVLGDATPGKAGDVRARQARRDLMRNVVTLINTLDAGRQTAAPATARNRMDVRDAVAAASRDLVQAGAPLRVNGWNTTQLCGLAAHTNRALLDLPPHRAAQAVRYNEGAID